MQLTRRTSLIIVAVLLALVAGGALYVRYRVNKAVAECTTPAPPEKASTPPPNLPGFQNGEACGPGGAPGPDTPAGQKK